MPVKPLHSVERALTVLEAIAATMPVGVSTLARRLDEDKSAVQRVLVTLHQCGWIAPTDEEVTRWKLTTRPLLVTSQAQDRSGPLQRVRQEMDGLRDTIDETMCMVVPEAGEVVIVDVLEGRQLIRIAPRVGTVLPSGTSAGGRAMAEPRPGTWARDRDVVTPGASSVASAVVEAGRAVGAIVVVAPTNRMGRRTQEDLGQQIARAALRISTP